jgi:hypothetical protein
MVGVGALAQIGAKLRENRLGHGIAAARPGSQRHARQVEDGRAGLDCRSRLTMRVGRRTREGGRRWQAGCLGRRRTTGREDGTGPGALGVALAALGSGALAEGEGGPAAKQRRYAPGAREDPGGLICLLCVPIVA